MGGHFATARSPCAAQVRSVASHTTCRMQFTLRVSVAVIPGRAGWCCSLPRESSHESLVFVRSERGPSDGYGLSSLDDRRRRSETRNYHIAAEAVAFAYDKAGEDLVSALAQSLTVGTPPKYVVVERAFDATPLEAISIIAPSCLLCSRPIDPYFSERWQHRFPEHSAPLGQGMECDSRRHQTCISFCSFASLCT